MKSKFSFKNGILMSFLLLILLFPLVGSVSGISNSMDSIQVNTLDSPLNFSMGDITESTIPDQGKIMNAAGATTGFKATGPVAVLEDGDPWGYNSVEDILNTFGSMEIDVIPSASFGTVSLSKYQKIIISSVQSVAFYTALDTNRTWLEEYVMDGGVLEVHAATYTGSPGEWILPGDFGLVWNVTENVEIADSNHYVLNNPNTINGVDLDNWGNSAHGYFNNTDDASIILTDGAGGPVLIEQRFGLGYIIATAQPVEYAYGANGYTDFLENLVWYVPTTANSPDETLTGSVAVLQDVNAWGWLGVNATQKILEKYGIDYTIIDSTSFGTADLSAYQKVIISADQSVGFYTALGTNKTWLENYVSAGGILEVHAATQGPDWILPGDIGFNYNGTDGIIVLDPSHYTLNYHYRIREPDLKYWSWSTHGYFNETAGSSIILTDGAEPVFVEKALGDGVIFATGQTVEYAWHFNFSYFLENLILFVPQPPTVTVTSPNGGEVITGKFNVTWDAADANKWDALTFDLDYWDGSSWVSITTGLTTTRYEWDTSGLPDGTDYKVRVVVTDGRFTEGDESDADFSINNHEPSISNVKHSPSAPTTADTINVTAEVTDLNGVKSVEVLYTINAGSELGITMTKVSGDTYAVDFTISFAVNDVVEYHIKAVDNDNFETDSTIKSFTVSAPPGIPGFSLVVAMLSLLSCGAIVYLIRRKRR